MFGYFPPVLVLCGLTLLWVAKTIVSLIRNIQIARASEIPYVLSPVDGIAGFFWTAIHDPIINTLNAFPYTRNWQLTKIIEPHKGWHHAEALRNSLGEFFLVISPNQIYLNLSNAAAITQMCARRNDFLKPVEIYGIVDMFGRSMLTSEGDEWKRHRKVVGPAFSEKSNALVWKESVSQAMGMLRFWQYMDGNEREEMRVGDTKRETALMTLHVISGAGFGVKQVWDDREERELGRRTISGFNTKQLKGSHEMGFKDALNTLLGGIIWMAIFPNWFLKLLPFQAIKKLTQAFFECGDYFKELLDYKIQQHKSGESEEKGTMDLMGPLIQASQTAHNDPKSPHLTPQDIIANSWIILFAGHESTANTLHHAFLYLALDLPSQFQLQASIDAITSSQPPSTLSYETHMAPLYNSMVGATMNETLRLMPPIIDIPKIVKGVPKELEVEGRRFQIPVGTFIHVNVVGVQRNPRYWPHGPSRLSGKEHDMDDFVPGRWLLPTEDASVPDTDINATTSFTDNNTAEKENSIFTSDTPLFSSSPGSPARPFRQTLLNPPKGAYIPFSSGPRACPGQRFAQVEITAALATIFSTYSLELDVSAWASDTEISKMGVQERREVYEKAKERTRDLMGGAETIVTLRMSGEVGVKFIKRGEGRERFGVCYK